jgi:hypothetical protein
MPSTISGLLVILFAILPGLPGDNLYQRIIGSDRREQQWQTVFRIIGFSLGGLILYVLAGSMVNAPLPIYISPVTFENFILERKILQDISISLTGHLFFSSLVGILVSQLVLLLNRLSRVSDVPDTWDKFASKYVEKHWIIVKLNSGQSYAGILDRADINVEQKERDIVLKEPAMYYESKGNYYALPYQYIFVSGSIIASVGVVSNSDDLRITSIGSPIFHDSFDKMMKKGEKK